MSRHAVDGPVTLDLCATAPTAAPAQDVRQA